MALSKKDKKLIELAKRISYQSDFVQKHGAVLSKGSTVITTAFNKNKFNSFAMRFRKDNPKHATIHAELGAILNVDRKSTEGATVYVVRTNKQQNCRLSKPCQMCEAAMRWVGIKKVIYSTNDGFEEIRL